MYLSYETYQNMGGTLDTTIFDNTAFEAETLLNLYTYNRLKGEENIPCSVQRCMFKLIELIQSKSSVRPSVDGSANNGTASIASQSNDGVSISYNVLSASEISASYKSDVTNVISGYLSDERNSKGHRLLFKGLYPDE